VRRVALLLLAAGALLAAAPANAVNPGQTPGASNGGGLPFEKTGSSVGEGQPFKAYASMSPTVHLFGDLLTAKLAVVADTKWVDPLRLRIATKFGPYAPVHAPQVLRLKYGRFEQITYTWKLRCLDSPCVPETPNTKFHVFHFHPARVSYVKADGTRAFGISAYWPPVEVISQISPGVERFLLQTKHINWRTSLSPIAKPTYNLSPMLAFWIAIALAVLAAGGAVLLGGRWYLAIRPQSLSFESLPGTPLERALAVLRYAHETGDETLQRKAFERVADELGVQRAGELQEVARELAWSSRTPEDEEVERFAAQALGAGEEEHE
jgi:hypothetical protein